MGKEDITEEDYAVWDYVVTQFPLLDIYHVKLDYNGLLFSSRNKVGINRSLEFDETSDYSNRHHCRNGVKEARVGRTFFGSPTPRKGEEEPACYVKLTLKVSGADWDSYSDVLLSLGFQDDVVKKLVRAAWLEKRLEQERRTLKDLQELSHKVAART